MSTLSDSLNAHWQVGGCARVQAVTVGVCGLQAPPPGQSAGQMAFLSCRPEAAAAPLAILRIADVLVSRWVGLSRGRALAVKGSARDHHAQVVLITRKDSLRHRHPVCDPVFKYEGILAILALPGCGGESQSK